MKHFKIEFNPIKDESSLIDHYRKHLLNHLVTVFKWKGFPEETPVEYIEMTLLTNGIVGFIRKGERLIPVLCNPAERPDEYYRATSYIYANPVIGSGEIKPDSVVFNDELSAWFQFDGREIIDKYARLLAAADISLKIALKNTRLTNVIVSDNEEDIININKMLSDMWEGAGAVSVSTKTLIGDGVKVFPTVPGGVDYLRQISETREYLYNLFLSEFGIHANTVLKRERQLTGEIDMQIEKPMFNIDSMLSARKKGAERINKTFGTNISVDIDPKYNYVEKTQEPGKEDKTNELSDTENNVDDVSDESSPAIETN